MTEPGEPHFAYRCALQIAPIISGIPESEWRFHRPPDVEILLRILDNDGNVMVDVMPDGRIVLGEHYDADSTARRFWGGLMYWAEQNFRR